MSNAKQRYAKLKPQREPYLNRGRAAASLTIPAVLPPQGSDGHDNLQQPYQGVGARAVKSLSSKMLEAILPPTQRFFRYTVDPVAMQEQSQASQGDIDQSLMLIEQAISSDIEAKHARAVLGEVLKQLVITGNSLLYLGNKAYKTYRLDKYVVRRNFHGEPVEIVVEETVYRDDLPKGIQLKLKNEAGLDDKKQTAPLYTWLKLTEGVWKGHQEVEGHKIPGSDSQYKEGACPWLPLRMVPVSGEDYGRSYVEEHIGDFHSLENLERAVQEASIVASRIVFLVKGNSTIKIEQLAKASNGGFVKGNPDDVQCLQLDKHADMSIARASADKIEAGIQESFMMAKSIQRSGERVTAEEIRTLANDLESVLGGIYTMLAAELQLPLVTVTQARMEDRGELPQLPKDFVEPQIVTGVDAMGRAAEFQRLQTFTQALAVFGPEVLAQNMKVDEYIKRVASSLGVNPENLVMSEEEKQRAMQQQMMQQAGPQIMQQAAAGAPQ